VSGISRTSSRFRTAAALAVAAVIGTVALGVVGFAPSTSHGGDALSVRDAHGWTMWWRRDAAPWRWNGTGTLASRMTWQKGRPGVEWGELLLRGASEAWRTRVVVVRLDPRRFDLSLAPAFLKDERWTIGDAGHDVALALDAGQFKGDLPYGWVVSDGREILKPQYAPLAGAVVVDGSGAIRVVSPDSVTAERERGRALQAFQSFPMLLENGEIPAPLRNPGLGVDLGHRDSRLALGTLDDGRVIVALTRFDALGKNLGRIPFGLTSPEMAAVMGSLGCRSAILLDGGISGQLLVQDSLGRRLEWAGIRSVPLGLVGRTRH
jgi:uncharacterized protein YigE (DUF2233 family)